MFQCYVGKESANFLLAKGCSRKSKSNLEEDLPATDILCNRDIAKTLVGGSILKYHGAKRS